MQAFAVENFGCRAARADGEAVSDRLRSAGLDERDPAAADVVVVNTCSVTAEADRAARAFIRRTHRRNPAARIVVTGCYAQRAPKELASLAGVSAVVGNSHKALAPQIVLGLLQPPVPSSGAACIATNSESSSTKCQGTTSVVPQMPREVSRALAPAGSFSENLVLDSARPSASEGLISVASLLPPTHSAAHAPIWADDRFAHSFLEEAQLVPGAQTRPNLKIQEGCGNRCTFCVIPQTRGSSRSLPAAAVLRQVEGFIAAGGNELVLSGINLGRWGRDLSATDDSEPRSLAALVRQILERTALPRLRLSSVEPMDWDHDLIGLMQEFAGTRVARHAHLPLQSGSDAVLRRMHRRYRPWHYEAKVQALIDAAGHELTLGADVMAGFPGETDREFAETLDFIRSLPFGYLHLFPFSPRPGTRAWGLHSEHPVPAPVVEYRMAQLRSLAAEKTRSHRTRFLGRELEALTLRTPGALSAAGRSLALTENFLPVEIDAPLPANRLLRIRVTSLDPDSTLRAIPAAEIEPQ